MSNIKIQGLASKRARWLNVLGLLALVACIVFPTDLQKAREAIPAKEARAFWVEPTEHQLRFVNTIVQIGLPLLLRDVQGITQLIAVGLSTTAVTHGLKRLLNKVHVGETRLGERPYSPRSRHNMPSGHSSMASCAAYFVARRYGWWHLLYLIPITLLTMGARVMLGDHTLSAVLAGCLVGVLCAALFTSRRMKHRPVKAEPK
jgi:membrane-associated phospholipid phosphatase